MAKLDSSGNSILYSTYLGGSSREDGWGIAVDSVGNAYVTGGTWSTNFPTTSPLQSTSGGSRDAFVAKITGAPVVSSINPNSALNTGSVNVTVTGMNFAPTPTLLLTKSGETTITATSTTHLSLTQLRAVVDLSGVATGAWNVVVQNPDGQRGTLIRGFTVTAPLPAPTVSSIAPTSVVNTGSVSVTVTGSNFIATPTLMLTKSGSSTLTATSTTYVSSQLLRSVVNVNGATTGMWNVVVRNPDGQSGMLPNAFSIGETPSLSINDVSVSEGNSGSTPATFTVSLSAAVEVVVTVNYATADGTATTANNDYVAKSGTLTFSSGQTSKQIAVMVNGDTTVEANETFYVNLSGATNATIGDGQGVGTITNDDSSPSNYQPDMQVRSSTVMTYVGDNIYNTTGVSQTAQQTVAKTVTATYILKLQNDGSVADTYVVQGTKAPTGWTVKYYDRKTGGTDVTAALTGSAGGVSPAIAPGAAPEFRVEVTPGATVAAGAVLEVFVTATSNGDTTKKDTVKAVTTVGAQAASQGAALTRLITSPNPAARGRVVEFGYTVHNQTDEPVTQLILRLICDGKVLGKPNAIRSLAGNAQASGVIRLRIPVTTAPGEYLVTGELWLPSRSRETPADRQTVKLNIE